MPELIDKKYLLAYLAEIKPDEYVSAFGEAAVQVIGLIEEFVKEMPTIEPEVRHGRWNYRHDDDWCYCTACGADAEGDCGEPLETLYCPSCGARMDGGADNAEYSEEWKRCGTTCGYCKDCN